MPPAPGESMLCTLFADVHYFFADPSTKPQHHRFSRGSYVYIYHNRDQQQAKLEIANHAGTPDQDAFSGWLSQASVQYSYKQPCLVTLRVDAQVQDHKLWHLPSYNERNEQKYLYKIHTVDLYLWTEKDAATFLGHLKAVMPANRLEIKDAPPTAAGLASPAEHRDSMSPVVQQLEKTAIGAQFPPRAESTASAHSLPGPPTPATTVTSAVGSPQQPAPMAYNPAAPPAPEPIAYREKTPPPPDDGQGTGLASAAKYDSVPVPQFAGVPQGYQNSAQPTPQQAYFAGPPTAAAQGGSFPGPPQGPSPNHQYTNHLPPPPPPAGGPSPLPQQQYAQHPKPFAGAHPTSPPPLQQTFQRQASFGGPPPAQPQFASYPSHQQQAQYANYPATPSFGPNAISSPGLPPGPGVYGQQPPTPSAPPPYTGPGSPGLPPLPAHPGLQHTHSAPPQSVQIAGFSNYNYQQSQSVQAQHMNQYGQYTGDIHNQLYRPTEAEAAHGHHAAPKPVVVKDDVNGKPAIEERVGVFERKMGRYLKMLDKTI